MKKLFLSLSIVLFGFIATANAQHNVHHVTRNNISSGSLFIPFMYNCPTGTCVQYETWTVTSGNLYINVSGIGSANLYGSGSFSFTYYGYYSPTASVTIHVTGNFTSGGGSGGGGGTIVPKPFEPFKPYDPYL